MRCPKCGRDTYVKKDGFFRRKSDSRFIQRLRCNACRKCFSYALKDPAYCQNKRRVNEALLRLLASNVSLRRSAIILGISRTTASRKLKYLGLVCRTRLQKLEQERPLATEIQFDDLITIEHTKCKPLSVSLAVHGKSRVILDWQISKMPASGRLVHIAKRKYGFRKDERRKGLVQLFKRLKSKIDSEAIFTTDDHPFYPSVVRRFFPKAQHIRLKGEKSSLGGQGELKKVKRDPLFTINHTFAMCRANINRLIRKTWCTTKDPDRLNDHLAIYAWFHNSILLKSA